MVQLIQLLDPTTIALLPIGYADGYLRIMQGSFVNVNGHLNSKLFNFWRIYE